MGCHLVLTFPVITFSATSGNRDKIDKVEGIFRKGNRDRWVCASPRAETEMAIPS